MRLLSDKPNQSGALTNTYGNEYKTYLGYGERIIGSKQLRDYVIIFTCSNESSTPTGQNGKIWKVNLNVTGTPVPILLYSGALSLSAYWPINDEIVTRYENENIHKVYWTDGYNYLRSANVATYLTTDGLVKSGSNSYLDPDLFNIVTEINFVTPLFTKFTSGNILVGQVQYAYKLYKEHGSETIFSPASAMIQLTTSAEGIDSSLYKGSDRLDSAGEPLSSGKGIQMSIIGVDTSYDKIEIIAIHYGAIHETPTISIVDTFNVSSNITFVDEGTYSQGTYTLSEFTKLSNPFKCKTITTKNNILFAANIAQEEFDIDYDARAYRWEKLYARSRIYDINGDYYYNSVPNPTIWRKNTGGGTYTIGQIPENWDCINRNNDLTLDRENTTYIYQQDLTTLGGEGLNVSYAFSFNQNWIDDGLNDKTFNSDSVIIPYYYTDYCSAEYAGKVRGYMRDEIYRFGVVFYSLQGQPSPVHWIGDVRMPSHDQLNEFVYLSGVKTGARILKVDFTFSNLPSNISGYQIVRVKREEKDRSIIFQGKMSFSEYSANFYYNRKNAFATAYEYYNYADTTEKKHVYISSPEISFYKDFVQAAGDYMQIIGTFPLTGRKVTPYVHVSTKYIFESYKYTGFTKPTLPNSRYAVIDTAILLSAPETPDVEYKSHSLGSFDYRKSMRYPLNGRTYLGDLGTCVLAKLSSEFYVSNLNGTSSSSTTCYMLVNYRRPVVQYGGKTYNDRLNNTYIKASEFIPRATSIVSSSYGDIFIGFTDHLTSYFNKHYYDSDASYGSVDMFPCETTINQNLRHDDCWHRVYNTVPECYFMREKSNAEFTPVGTTTYTPGWTDYYQYNTVYSRMADSQKYYPKPYDYDTIPVNDVLITASNVKLNNEEIDSWTQFLVNENLEVDGSFGKINYIRAWNNQLYYWQDNAFGLASVLDRSLIQDSSGQNLSLGEGVILNRFDTLVNEIGCSTKNSLTVTSTGCYWLDWKRRGFIAFNGKIESLSLVKGMHSYFEGLDASIGTSDNVNNTTVSNKGFSITYNPKFKEVFLNIKSDTYTGETLVYNELQQAFTLFLDHQKCAGFIKQDNILYSTLYEQGAGFTGTLYLENSTYVARGFYYGAYYNSYVETIVNPASNNICTFTGLEVSSNVYDVNNVEIHDKTITKYQVRNDYQDTGEITVSSSNARRLFRTWRISAIRDSISGKPRLRDSYMKVKLIFKNDATVNVKNTIVLNDLVSIYTGLPESFINKQN
jgi:hypothetical protein